MVDLKDYITFDIYSDPFELTADNYSKGIFLVQSAENTGYFRRSDNKVTNQFNNEEMYTIPLNR